MNEWGGGWEEERKRECVSCVLVCVCGRGGMEEVLRTAISIDEQVGGVRGERVGGGREGGGG